MKIIHIFIYLADVDINAGPFCYIPGSHQFNWKSVKPRSNYDLGILDAYGRIPDKEILKYYPVDDWLPAVAKKGSVIITDVCGWHKGPMWTEHSNRRFRDILHINLRSRDISTFKNSIRIKKKDTKDFSELQNIILSNYKVTS